MAWSRAGNPLAWGGHEYRVIIFISRSHVKIITNTLKQRGCRGPNSGSVQGRIRSPRGCSGPSHGQRREGRQTNASTGSRLNSPPHTHITGHTFHLRGKKRLRVHEAPKQTRPNLRIPWWELGFSQRHGMCPQTHPPGILGRGKHRPWGKGRGRGLWPPRTAPRTLSKGFHYCKKEPDWFSAEECDACVPVLHSCSVPSAHIESCSPWFLIYEME